MSSGTGGVWSGQRGVVCRLALWAVVGILGLPCCGCSLIKAAAYFAQPETVKVAPEFNRLPEKQVLVYVWAEPEILWNYSKLRLDLSAYLGAYLRQHVEKVTMVDAIQVERYVEQQRTPDLDPVELGRQFKADMVIHVSVHQFSIRDPEMAHFYRGRIGASVQVYDLTSPDEPERVVLQDVMVVVPEEGPLGLENATAAQVRQMSYDAFTVAVGKKFHQWERPNE